jgi:hypothetical protein
MTESSRTMGPVARVIPIVERGNAHGLDCHPFDNTKTPPQPVITMQGAKSKHVTGGETGGHPPLGPP